jgi:hypothetical protein
MKLTDKHLEDIRKAAEAVDYGRLTINIAASARTLDLIVENHLKLEKEPETPEVLEKA